MKEPNNKIVKILTEEKIEYYKEIIKELQISLRCKHEWKYIDNYYGEDCQWKCSLCKRIMGIDGNEFT